MSEHINEGAIKVIEIIGISSKSFDDAILQAVNKASKSVKGITGFEVLKHMASVKDGKITQYKVNLKLAFPVIWKIKGVKMSLQVKYSPVLALAQELKLQALNVKEEAGKLNLSGTVNTPYEKNKIWDKIKEVGGEGQTEVSADIKVLNTEYFHLHTVESGVSLSKISKHYYKDANKYMQIFNANKDQLTNPDMIKVGQKIKIPNP